MIAVPIHVDAAQAAPAVDAKRAASNDNSDTARLLDQYYTHHHDGRRLVIDAHRFTIHSRGAERARTLLSTVASTISAAQVEQIPSLTDLGDVLFDRGHVTLH